MPKRPPRKTAPFSVLTIPTLFDHFPLSQLEKKERGGVTRTIGNIYYRPPIRETLRSIYLPPAIDLSAGLDTPFASSRTDVTSLERSGILQGKKLHIPTTLRALAAIKQKFPDLKELEVGVAYGGFDSKARERLVAAAKREGTYSIADYPPKSLVKTRTIRLRKK